MSKNNRTYTLEHKNRKAVVATGSLPIIKNCKVVGYTQPCTTVVIYCKKTGNILDSYELPDYKEFGHYLSLVRYCNSVRHANKEQFFDKRLAPLSEHSHECSGASPIAPMSHTSTGSDTPIYIIIDKTPQQATITIKGGQKQLMQWNTPIEKPTLHLGWRKIVQSVQNKHIIFKNENEQIFFTNLAKKSFGYDRRLQFKDLLKNKYSFIE